MGDFNPDAQVKGFLTLSLIALICNSFSAVIAAVSEFNTMAQMYRIFYLNKAFFLCDSPSEHIKNIKIEHINDLCLALREWMEEEEDYDLCFYGIHKNQMLDYLKDFYIYIEAAGGVVKNSNDEYLFIKRFNLWDLPKGKVEKEESSKNAAIREVVEETGIEGLSIVKPISNSWHIYPWKEQTVLKKTFWYLMRSNYKGELIPQAKEDITEAAWLNSVDAKQALQNSYRSLKENLAEYIR